MFIVLADILLALQKGRSMKKKIIAFSSITLTLEGQTIPAASVESL